MPDPVKPARRLLPESDFPSFAYVPGRQGRPREDHLIEHASPRRQFAWAIDLFNHGYYWEAHEAWEVLWATSRKGSRRRLLLKGLIRLAAAGVKACQSNAYGVARHAAGAEAIFSQLAQISGRGSCLGLSVHDLTGKAKRAQIAPDRIKPGDPAGIGFVLTMSGRLSQDIPGGQANTSCRAPGKAAEAR